jgi:hypothetical protein
MGMPTWADLQRHVGAATRDDTTSHLTDDEIAREIQANPDLLDAAQHLTKRYGVFVAIRDLRRRVGALPSRS